MHKYCPERSSVSTLQADVAVSWLSAVGPEHGPCSDGEKGVYCLCPIKEERGGFGDGRWAWPCSQPGTLTNEPLHPGTPEA